MGYPSVKSEEIKEEEQDEEELATDWKNKFKERYILEKKWKIGRPIVYTLNGRIKIFLTIIYLGHSGTVTCLAYNELKNKFITGSDDGSAVMWNTNTAIKPSKNIFQQHHRQTQPINKLMSFQGHGIPSLKKYIN
jgi:WD40 repeat protein